MALCSEIFGQQSFIKQMKKKANILATVAFYGSLINVGEKKLFLIQLILLQKQQNTSTNKYQKQPNTTTYATS